MSSSTSRSLSLFDAGFARSPIGGENDKSGVKSNPVGCRRFCEHLRGDVDDAARYLSTWWPEIGGAWTNSC